MARKTTAPHTFLRSAIRLGVIAAAAGAFPLIATATSGVAQADFTVCNNTSKPVDVTVGWVDPHGNGFTSQGWWTLQPGGHCELLVLNSETSDPNNYFYYAEQHGDSLVWRGDTTLCTENDAFLISGPADRNWCDNVGFIARDFRHVFSPSGNHTTNLTGPGRQNIDDPNGVPFDDNQ